VELRAVPAFHVGWRQDYVSDVEMLRRWEAGELWSSAEWVRVWWLPHSRRAIVWHADKLSPPERAAALARNLDKISALARIANYLSLWSVHALHRALHILAYLVPRAMPLVERVFFGLQFGFGERNNVAAGVAPSRLGLTADCLYSQTVNEWALPLSRGPEALARLSALLTPDNPLRSPSSPKNDADEPPPSPRTLFPHSPIEVRVADTTLTPEARGFLDPSCPSEPTLYLNSVSYQPLLHLPAPGLAQWTAAFEATLAPLGGRPHWAKNFATRHPQLAQMYPADMPAWRAVRRRVDPDGVFVGSWLRARILPPAGDDHDPGRLPCEEVFVARRWSWTRGWMLEGRCPGDDAVPAINMADVE
jgi:D-arabinono-1,4-lactone oxidase